jgi:hypothetical protein
MAGTGAIHPIKDAVRSHWRYKRRDDVLEGNPFWLLEDGHGGQSQSWKRHVTNTSPMVYLSVHLLSWQAFRWDSDMFH